MKFNVLWMPIAEQRLAQLWISALDRNAVAAAADLLDAALKRNPLTLGESRVGTTKVAFEEPLGILFEVSEPDRRVRVLDIWRTHQPESNSQ
jgi:hypothetical protein